VLDATFKEWLENIDCPTFAIHGEEDPVLGVEHAEFLRGKIRKPSGDPGPCCDMVFVANHITGLDHLAIHVMTSALTV